MGRVLGRPNARPAPRSRGGDAASLRAVSVVLAGLAATTASACTETSKTRDDSRPPAPVEVGAVKREPIELRRTYNGTVEAPARFVVAPNVGGRVERLTVDLGDAVERGQLVAELQDDEFRQLAAQAAADLTVARANRDRVENDLAVARRELKRIETLRERGVSSEAQLDSARAEELQRRADLEVAEAQIVRARSALEAARTRLGYTRVTADWSGGNDERVVAQRHVSAGASVAENDPMFTIVQLAPILAVIYVAEREYALLRPDQRATLRTDAHPGETFEAKVDRISPVFEPGSRQARVELRLENGDRRLKPGMFARVTVSLRRVDDAVVVPFHAITTRDDRQGVFVLADDGSRVRWHPVEVGIRDGDRIQILDQELTGRVVTLGHQLVEDGARVKIPEVETSTG